MKALIIAFLVTVFLSLSSLSLAIQASSDVRPANFAKSRGKVQVNYNVRQVTIKDMDGKTRKIWRYEYVEIEEPVTKAKFKEALRKQDMEKEKGAKWDPDVAKEEYEQEKITAGK